MRGALTRRLAGASRRVLGTVLGAAVVLASPSPALAGVEGEMQNFMSDMGAQANVTGPSAYQGQSAGYYSGGAMWARFPPKNIQPFNIQLPHARARARHALDVEETVLARQHGHACGELSGIELPAIASRALDPEFACRSLKPRHGNVGRHEHPAPAGSGIDPVQYLLLARERCGRGHEIVVPIEPVGLAGDQMPLAYQFAEARFCAPSLP